MTAVSSAAAAALAVAMLAACSSTQLGSAPGSSPSGRAVSARERVPAPRFYPISRLSPANVLRMQLAGQFPTRESHSAFVASYERAMKHRGAKPAKAHRGKVGIWTTAFDSSELLGLTRNAKKAVLTVDVEGCDYPQSVRVDADKNVWTACEYGDSTEGGAIQEYGPSGALLAQYTSACPSNLPSGSCANGWFSYFFDGASGGNLACGAAEDYEYEPNASSSAYGTGFICWPRGNPSAGSTLIPVWQHCSGGGSCDIGTDCDPVCEVWEADLDSSGNIYFTYYGENSSCFGGGIGEVLNPGKASQSINIIASPCQLEFPGGAYVSNYGAVLNAQDQDERLIYQYHLPASSSSTPFRTLGPTKTNSSGYGDPDGMGFNQADTKIICGDAYGWFDVGIIKTNKWSMLTTPYSTGPAAYTPSDK
jgi:hypothetical protein